MGRLFNIVLLIAGIAALVLAFDYFSPVKVSSLISGTGLEGGTCLKVTNIETDDMEPLLTQGESVVFDRCIEGKRENLQEGTVVLVEQGYFKKDTLGVIRRRVVSARGDYYRVSTVKSPKDITEVQPENISAVYEKP